MPKQVVVPIAHDFTCPWCWIALFQAKRMKSEFGVAIEWRGYELWPEELEWPESRPSMTIPNKPSTPSRLDFIKMMDAVEIPTVERPKRMRVHAPLEAVEYVKNCALDRVDDFVEAVYRAHWERGERIGDIPVIVDLARPFVEHPEELTAALEDRRYLDRIVHFDAPSYKAGIFNVPTFWIGDERFAEQPYQVLRRALIDQGNSPISLQSIYSALQFPPAPHGRPYVAINMVASIDGKILTGRRDEPVVDLGSKFDHDLMKRIESSVDAVMVGAQTLRAAKKSWNPRAKTRVVVTRSGNLDFDACFFSEQAILATTEGQLEAPPGVEVLRIEDLPGLLFALKNRGVERLLVLGGSTLNAQLFEMQLVDEIFITIAPKIKLGEDVPTIADGNALPRESIQNYGVVEQHQVGDEIFVRYRKIH
jgi:riboflavin biosynthesis pyrimidine reductase/predicted DsbA family dithiol-disulfide isomerase